MQRNTTETWYEPPVHQYFFIVFLVRILFDLLWQHETGHTAATGDAGLRTRRRCSRGGAFRRQRQYVQHRAVYHVNECDVRELDASLRSQCHLAVAEVPHRHRTMTGRHPSPRPAPHRTPTYSGRLNSYRPKFPCSSEQFEHSLVLASADHRNTTQDH